MTLPEYFQAWLEKLPDERKNEMAEEAALPTFSQEVIEVISESRE